MDQDQDEEVPVEDVSEIDEPTPYRYTITSYGADYPVDGLVKRMKNGDIVVPTFDPPAGKDLAVEGYQREFIWTRTQCDRFIESLLLGLPVPGIFLVRQDDGRHLVLDGQQRLRTLHSFYSGLLRGKEFKLETVQDRYRGLAYETLDAEDRRTLDDSIIHATIVKQDEPSGDQSSIYLIFERLNSGGTSLQPQEIRVALYSGPLMSLLRELNEYDPWRRIYGKKSKRLKDQELILRFLAFRFWSSNYERPMKDFLNRYASINRNLDQEPQHVLERSFKETIDAIIKGVGESAFRLKSAVNAAVMDSVMVGVSNRIDEIGAFADPDSLAKAYRSLVDDQNYLDSVTRATADNLTVRARVKLATEAFSKVT